MSHPLSDDHDAPRRREARTGTADDEAEARSRRKRDGLIAECQRVAARVRPLYDSASVLHRRLDEPGIWFLVGLPSAGKSTVARAIGDLGRRVVQIDEIRAEHGWLLGQDEWGEDAYRIAYERLGATMDRGVVFESTGLWAPAREWCLYETRTRGVPVRAVVIGTDARVCAAREAQRRGPDHPFFLDVLGAYAKTIESLPNEGYDSIHWMDEGEQARVVATWH